VTGRNKKVSFRIHPLEFTQSDGELSELTVGQAGSPPLFGRMAGVNRPSLLSLPTGLWLLL
jgi:hypothetical protein